MCKFPSFALSEYLAISNLQNIDLILRSTKSWVNKKLTNLFRKVGVQSKIKFTESNSELIKTFNMTSSNHVAHRPIRAGPNLTKTQKSGWPFFGLVQASDWKIWKQILFIMVWIHLKSIKQTRGSPWELAKSCFRLAFLPNRPELHLYLYSSIYSFLRWPYP